MQEFFESARLGNVDDFPRGWQQVGRSFYSVLLFVDILDMHDADGVVEVVVFAQGEAGIIALPGNTDAFGDFGVGVQPDDICPGLHGFACDAVAEIERVHHNVAAEP